MKFKPRPSISFICIPFLSPTGTWRGVRSVGNVFYPPHQGWADKDYYIVFTPNDVDGEGNVETDNTTPITYDTPQSLKTVNENLSLIPKNIPPSRALIGHLPPPKPKAAAPPKPADTKTPESEKPAAPRVTEPLTQTSTNVPAVPVSAPADIIMVKEEEEVGEDEGTVEERDSREKNGEQREKRSSLPDGVHTHSSSGYVKFISLTWDAYIYFFLQVALVFKTHCERDVMR